MTNVFAYVHPSRTYLPCTGVGRHINNILLGLTRRSDINVTLLFSKQWLGADGKLDPRSPLRELPQLTFPTAENKTERLWKLIGFPRLDEYVPDQTDWFYAPMETYLPVSTCPVAITLHDIQAFETEVPWSRTWQHRWFGYKYGRWVGRALKECRVVFTVSEFSRQRLVALAGADPEKVVVVGNGVDPAFFEIGSIDPTKLERPTEAPYILVVGGLRYKKGGHHVLAVAEKLRRCGSEVQLVVAGESEPEFVQQAHEHPNLKVLGMVPDQDLPRLVRAASLLLFLSLYEGFGIPALEAMAAGIPAVVANRGSLPEIVGQAGLIVEPEATDEIVDLVSQLINDPALHQHYSQLGPPHAAQYTWAGCVDRVVEAFHRFA